MYNLMDSNISWMAVIFSILLIMIGSFFLLNVILAVLAEALTNVDVIQQNAEAKQNEAINRSLERRRLQDEKALRKKEGKDSLTNSERASHNPTPDSARKDSYLQIESGGITLSNK